MADKGMTLAIVLLVAGLIVGGGIGYFAAPTKIVEMHTTFSKPPSFYYVQQNFDNFNE